MRKTEATIHARIESHHYKVPVELWSRGAIREGIEIPRIARTWVLLNPNEDDDAQVQKRRDELDGRGFRFERTVIEGGRA